jgi:hypothetical protein
MEGAVATASIADLIIGHPDYAGLRPLIKDVPRFYAEHALQEEAYHHRATIFSPETVRGLHLPFPRLWL